MSSTTSKRERQKSRRAERRAAAAAEARRRQLVRRVRLAVIALLVGVGILGGALLLVRGADATLGVPAAEASGEALPELPADPSAGDPAIGQSAPRVAGYDPDRGSVVLGATGSPQAVSFVAHWCPHCQEEIPEIVEWVSAGGLPDGVDLVAVSTQHEPARPNWPPDEWLAREGWPGAILVDHDLTASAAFAARGTPFWVFLDADGTVVARHPGRLSLEQLEAYVAAFDG